MSLIETYFSYQVKYANKYGPNTIVFMEVGSFFEIYGADSKEGGKIIHRISNLLNLHVSRKNGKHKKDSPYMAGFPNYALEKYVKVLLQNSFTIVIMEQHMVEGSKKPERSVTRILSPGTDLDHTPTFHSNHLVSLYVDIVQPVHRPKKVLYCGMAMIDVTTGLSQCSEFHVPYSNVSFAMSQISEKLHSIHPSEIIWASPHSTKDAAIQHHAAEYAAVERILKTQPCLVHRISSLENISLQDHLLATVYPHHGTLSVIEFLGLSRHTHARNAFAQLLRFVETHHAIALQNLPKPKFEAYKDQCTLASSTLDQLQIISKGSSRTRPSLFNIVNKCSTAMGKRCLFERLTHPIFDIATLKGRYQGIQNMMKPPPIDGNRDSVPAWKRVEPHLDGIVDIERLHRRMELAKLRPAECASFHLSYREIHNILATLASHDIRLSSTPNTALLDQFIEDVARTFDVDKMARYTLDTVDESFFCLGKYPHIDDLQSALEEKRARMESWRLQYNDLIDPTKTTVRLVTTDKDGTYMSLTKNRYAALQVAIQEDAQETPSYIPLDSLRAVHSKSDIKLKGGQLRSTSDEITRCMNALRAAVCEQYQACMKAYCETYEGLFHSAVTFIAEVDVFKSGAKCATVYGYCCPQLRENDEDESKSWVELEDVRHPIIERIQDDIPYITNDISFDSTEQQGILLYGVNAAGKSSLMKAVGVNIILAQAGLFVAASSMRLSPYRNIFTRLTKEDNMYEGLSSFAVEMTELRNILLRADEHSIVLGDELCSGTESVSALAIVSAGIIQLYNRGTTFFFATHLHKLSKIPRLSGLPKLKKFHLSVTYEPATGVLRYDRKLSPGIGSSLYGLEVCKGMDMPSDFMDIAASIREDIDDNVAERTVSQYNASLIRYDCGVCGEPAVDTHHIQFQELADETTGMIGHIHKNRKSNLVCVCETCHHAVHHGQLMIRGYAQTTKGRILHYEWTNDQQQEKKKFKTNHIQWIVERCESKMPVHVLKSLFEEQFNLSISNSSVSKIRNGTY